MKSSAHATLSGLKRARLGAVETPMYENCAPRGLCASVARVRGLLLPRRRGPNWPGHSTPGEALPPRSRVRARNCRADPSGRGVRRPGGTCGADKRNAGVKSETQLNRAASSCFRLL